MCVCAHEAVIYYVLERLCAVCVQRVNTATVCDDGAHGVAETDGAKSRRETNAGGERATSNLPWRLGAKTCDWQLSACTSPLS